MKRWIWIGVGVIGVTAGIAGGFVARESPGSVAFAETPDGVGRSATSEPTPHDLTGLDATTALARANEWRETHPDVMTALTTTSIDFAFPSGERRGVALPADRMVVAIAPYLNRTHPCAVHSISGCQGELPGRDFAVVVADPSGKVVLNDTYRTLSNGFIELWLPRDGEFAIAISGMEKNATGRVSTLDDGPTCRSEFRLL